MSKASSGWLLWLAKYIGGGIVSYAAPRVAIGLGLPLDSWFVAMGNWFSLHVSREFATNTISVLVGAALLTINHWATAQGREAMSRRLRSWGTFLTSWRLRIERVGDPASPQQPMKHEPTTPPYTKVRRTFERTNFLGEGAVSLPLDQGLYVGNITIDVPLLRENYVTIAVRCFNGSGSRARITAVAGSIGYLFSSPSARTIADSAVVGELPSPHRSTVSPSEFADLAEMFIVLEQRVPASIATQMLSALSAEEEIELVMDGLDVSCVFIDAEHITTRIPLWPAVKIKKVGDAYVTDRVVVGKMEAIG